MQKRFPRNSEEDEMDGYLGKKQAVAKTGGEVTINKTQRVAVYSIYDARLSYASPSTGELYNWSKIGDSVLVATEDVSFLLEKRLGSRSCCGGVNQDGNKIFEKVS